MKTNIPHHLVNPEENGDLINTPQHAYRYLMRNCYEPEQMFRECVWAVFLNKQCRVVGKMPVCIGGLDMVVLDIKLVIQAALLCSAHSVIISHNHPNGNPLPSQQDIRQTSEIKNKLRVLDIQLADHIIIGNEQFFSFAEDIKLDAPADMKTGEDLIKDAMEALLSASVKTDRAIIYINRLPQKSHSQKTIVAINKLIKSLSV